MQLKLEEKRLRKEGKLDELQRLLGEGFAMDATLRKLMGENKARFEYFLVKTCCIGLLERCTRVLKHLQKCLKPRALIWCLGSLRQSKGCVLSCSRLIDDQ